VSRVNGDQDQSSFWSVNNDLSVIGFTAFLSFCAALIIKLISYMDPVFAALVTGAAFALFGVVIVFIGYRQLKK